MQQKNKNKIFTVASNGRELILVGDNGDPFKRIIRWKRPIQKYSS